MCIRDRKKYMDDNPEQDEGTELLESMTSSMNEDMPEEVVAEEAPMEEEINTEEAPSMGLMARGV